MINPLRQDFSIKPRRLTRSHRAHIACESGCRNMVMNDPIVVEYPKPSVCKLHECLGNRRMG